MAADSNMGSHQASMPSFNHPRMVSFQSGAIDSSTGMIPFDMCSLDGNGNMASMFMSAGSGLINHMDPMASVQCSPGSVLREPMMRFMHVSGSPAACWSQEEMQMLNVGLVNYANEPSIQKYAKIAATMPQRTIRDVALRCQLMIIKENHKRRKLEEYYVAKKMKEMKEKMVGSSSTASVSGVANSLIMHRMNIHDHCQSVVLDAEVQHLLDQNDRLLRDIARNIEGGMVQENISLFLYMRNNIIATENRINAISATMNQLPGSRRQMPLLSISINDKLLGDLIPLSGNDIHTAPGSNHLQLDPTSFRPTTG